MKTFFVIIVAIVFAVLGWLFLARRKTARPAGPGAATTTTAVSREASSTVGETKTADIVITYPLQDQVVTSPLSLTGKAKGTWYFEATAPVFLTDENGQTLAQGNISAQGDWMTTTFVPFVGTLSWVSPTGTSTKGYVVFQNDNPSGDPNLQKSVRVPVRFR